MAPARLGIAGLVSVMALLVTGPAAAVADPGKQMVSHVNAFRAAHGRRGLLPSGHLARSSRAHARRVIQRDRFAHGATTPRRGEVLSIHYGDSLLIADVVRAWERSDVHRDLLLDPAYRTAGAGYAQGSFGGRRATVWVVRVKR